MGELVDWARELVAARMAVVLPQRFAHVQAVAAKAGNLRPILDGDADLLVTAAWLHDIGYAPTVEDTGFPSARRGAVPARSRRRLAIVRSGRPSFGREI